MKKGYLSLVLHAHLPFVRHPESKNYIEERWLFEAITETYIPLLQVFQRLLSDKIPFNMTLSLTPTLLSMLQDDLLQQRYRKFLEQLIHLAEREVKRTENVSEFHELALYYLNNFKKIQDFYHSYDGNLVRAFREVSEQSGLTLITSAATHAFLPLLLTQESIRAQIATAVSLHESCFGKKPNGIWLPECGYTPIVGSILSEFGIDYFFTDTHGILSASPTPLWGTASPVLTPDGVAAFGRDETLSRQVWSAQEGYPGDHDYREWYRDIGYDLPLSDVGEFLPQGTIRLNTGMKYFRVTGTDEEKSPYRLDWAAKKVQQHAMHFLTCAHERIQTTSMDRQPVITASFDAELFGHWWYEGPYFLEQMFRLAYESNLSVFPISAEQYLHSYETYQVCEIPVSSWGRGGYANVWLQPANDWIYPALHSCEQKMVYFANKYAHSSPSPLMVRALNQAARELVLAQSSDWAFIMDNQTMVDYAVKRTKWHINRFFTLIEQIQTNSIQKDILESMEQLDFIFPNISYLNYVSQAPLRFQQRDKTKKSVLLLSWEFPPLTVGGLSRHVADLSRHLVQLGWDVHVLTASVLGSPLEERWQGVHVHRVDVMQPDGDEFFHWVFQLNRAMISRVLKLFEEGLRFDVLHAHDWLVAEAAHTLQEQLSLPLVATIHATESGRNQGIHSSLQAEIHELEKELTHHAQQVIVCSQYMKNEVQTLFQVEANKIQVLPNGVDPATLQNEPSAKKEETNEKNLLFIGRLVREKGIHVLLQAVPKIIKVHPEIQIFIAGTGPALDELEHIVKHLNVSDHVHFTGFADDALRNALFQKANVAVFPSLYEPFGIVALEAIASDVPLAVSDVGGLADIVTHDKNGVKFYPNDSNSLALQVNRLLSNPEWAFRMARHAKKELSHYDWSVIAQNTINLYTDLL